MAKGKDLIIVESPAKTRTLSSFLSGNYEVRASMGHVRDLPKSKLNVDPDNNFEPTYEIIPDRRSVVSELKKLAKDAENVYLASDPDREGEAIAWHLAEALGVKNPRRIEFHEITKTAVNDALANPHTINMERVNAQQARRVLDRLVGYKISPLLWKKVQKNLSAGRVQSVAVRLVVEREREIKSFVTDEYWSLRARLTPRGQEFPFEARLHQIGGKKPELGHSDSLRSILEQLGHELVEVSEGEWEARPLVDEQFNEWKVAEVKRREQRRNPSAPFITSTIQQEAARKLGFNARRTMQVAQQLYEGVELGADGHVGLITYMRTDSTNVANEAQAEARNFISRQYGDAFNTPTPRTYKSGKGAQEAHEAIRPTSVFRTPDRLREHLTSDQFRLYQLVWQRFLASQMEAAVFDVTTIDITVEDMLFRATGRVVKFEGFMAVYMEGRDDRNAEEQEEDAEEGRRIPSLNAGDLLNLLGLNPDQHFTEPPPRFTEATLVRALEEKGIGRPSTYAQIMSTIIDREYVELKEKRFSPTDLGSRVNDQLVKHFPNIVNSDFTANVEQELDDVAEGSRQWVDVLNEFYGPFTHALARAESEMERGKVEARPTGVDCPLCGKPMVLRMSKLGRFLGCSGYPGCKNTLQLSELPEGKGLELLHAEYRDELVRLIGDAAAGEAIQRYSGVPRPTRNAHGRLSVLAAIVAGGTPPNAEASAAVSDDADEDAPTECPNCGKPMQKRVGRFGAFWGCTGYPECKTIVDPKKKTLAPPDPDFSMPCPRPNCDGTVTAKRSWRGTVFYGCSNFTSKPKCEYVSWGKPDPEHKCETCEYPMYEKMFRGKSQGWKCTNADCPTNPPVEKKAKPARGGARATSAARSTTKTAPKTAAKTARKSK